MPPDPRARLAIGAAAAVLLAYAAAGSALLDGFVLDLGSLFLPPPRTLLFFGLWLVFGSTAAVLLARGLGGLASDTPVAAPATARDDRRRVLLIALAAAALPALVRFAVLRGVPLTDDESAYRFMAELIASGRLTAPSPEPRLFFDRAFMINDGRFYAGYFVGWPAIAALGALVGAPGYVNALLAGLTVPPLWGLARRLAGRRVALFVAALGATAPMLVVGAATELSHTSCLCLLTWCAWAVVRSRGPGAARGFDVLAAAAFAGAFCVRPLSALAIGLPYLAAWLRSVWRDRPRRLVRLAAFALPSGALAAAFLGVNAVQNGSPLLTAYDRLLAYQAENGWRFAAFSRESSAQFGNFRIAGWRPALANSAIAALRLGVNLFGWPLSYALAVFAAGARRALLPAASLGLFFALHLFVSDPGIDTFGPVHYFETALPILLLTAVGARRLVALARRRRGARSPAAATSRALGPALLVVAVLGYWPVEIGALRRIADTLVLPGEAVEAAGLHDAVVFSPRPWAPTCRCAPTDHWVFFRPNNDPDLRDDVLWVNHLTVVEDRALMTRFPGRTGWLMWWDRSCTPRLFPIERVPESAVPPGLM